MPKLTVLVRLCAFLACSSVLAVAATPSFTVSATATTMPTSGFGAVPITLTSVNSYSGTISATCVPANPPAGALLPICGSPLPRAYQLAANSSTTGTIPLEPSPYPIAAARLHTSGFGGAAGLVLGAGFLFGFTRRRRARRWLTLSLLAFGTFAGMAGISACGGNSGTFLTPGTYSYTVTATDVNTSDTATTTVNITVPRGVPTTQ
ncbi:MAG: hypothetical protein WBD67_09960 [Terracidiphilus sp.]